MSAAEDFYSFLIEEDEISEEETQATLETGQEIIRKTLDEPGDLKQGLLFGRIQSGKTNKIIMAIACAADRGSKVFIVLTSDNTWLYDQTCKRLRAGLPSLFTVDKTIWPSPDSQKRIQASMSTYGVVFCSTKNTRVLDSLITALRQLNYTENNMVFIVDDEADQATLNTEVSTDNAPSAVYQSVMGLRDLFPRHSFIQVTATPQALLLQKAGDDVRPDFVVPFVPGEAYLGGNDFFRPNTPQESLVVEIPEAEPNRIIHSNREFSGFACPTGVRCALCSFFVNAAVKAILGERNKKFSSLFHLSHTQHSHNRLKVLIENFIEKAVEVIHRDDEDHEKQIYLEYLREARNDLARTFQSNLPDEAVIFDFIKTRIVSTHVQVLNSENPGQPSYDTFFNIFIGGNRLSRGVTFSRLLVTYYGRNAKSPQMDTILQHARMFGYRQNDREFIRFYTTGSLSSLFSNIAESDAQLSESLQTSGSLDRIQTILLNRSTAHLNPTRRKVLPIGDIYGYFCGKRYFPNDPICTNVEQLNALLGQYVDRRETTPVPIDFLLEILSLTKSNPIPSASWNDDAIKRCLENIRTQAENQNRGALVVRVDRDIKRYFRAMLDPADENLFDPNVPTLTIYRFTGSREKGWDGNPLWVPALRFPDDNKSYIFNPSGPF